MAAMTSVANALFHFHCCYVYYSFFLPDLLICLLNKPLLKTVYCIKPFSSLAALASLLASYSLYKPLFMFEEVK